MKTMHRFPIMAAALAAMVTLSFPSGADAKSDREGKHGRSEGRRADRQVRGESRSERGGDRQYARRDNSREVWNRAHDRMTQREQRGGREYRGDRSGQRQWRGDSQRGRTYERQPVARREVRYRDSGGATRYRDSGYRDGYRRSSTPRTRYRNASHSYGSYGPRHYYTSYFHRPRFVYHSGFSIGITIGSAPAYGYRYYDPYCHVRYSDLGAYYDHCLDHSHAEVILVVDSGSGHPIATCAYDDGYWVVDDCDY